MFAMAAKRTWTEEFHDADIDSDEEIQGAKKIHLPTPDALRYVANLSISSPTVAPAIPAALWGAPRGVPIPVLHRRTRDECEFSPSPPNYSPLASSSVIASESAFGPFSQLSVPALSIPSDATSSDNTSTGTLPALATTTPHHPRGSPHSLKKQRRVSFLTDGSAPPNGVDPAAAVGAPPVAPAVTFSPPSVPLSPALATDVHTSPPARSPTLQRVALSPLCPELSHPHADAAAGAPMLPGHVRPALVQRSASGRVVIADVNELSSDEDEAADHTRPAYAWHAMDADGMHDAGPLPPPSCAARASDSPPQYEHRALVVAGPLVDALPPLSTDTSEGFRRQIERHALADMKTSSRLFGHMERAFWAQQRAAASAAAALAWRGDSDMHLGGDATMATTSGGMGMAGMAGMAGTGTLGGGRQPRAPDSDMVD